MPKKIDEQTNTPPMSEAPEAVRRQPRKRQVARAEHLRQQHDRDRLEDRHREQEHHHRAVQREDLVVGLGRQEIVVGPGELDAHQRREHAAEQEKQQRRRRVPLADFRVVHFRPVAPALEALPTRSADALPARVEPVRVAGGAGSISRFTAVAPDRRRASASVSSGSCENAGMCAPGLSSSVLEIQRRNVVGPRRQQSRGQRLRGRRRASGRARRRRARRFRGSCGTCCNRARETRPGRAAQIGSPARAAGRA